MRKLLAVAAIAVLGLAGCAHQQNQGDSVKAVYHINEGTDKATDLLRNVRNHINSDPKAKIVVVGHGKGIDFMLDGAEDKNKNPFNVTMEGLAAKGVEFRVCNNTLVSRKIDKSKVVMPATIVPSGVAEVARLQNAEGYSYVKP